MKQITRTQIFYDPPTNSNKVERFWLTEHGLWSRDRAGAFAFDDQEAARRLRRLPRAVAVNPDEEPSPIAGEKLDAAQ